MGWFAESEYSKLKKLVDNLPVMQKASMSVEGLMGNISGQLPLMEAIKKAGSEGKITAAQAEELIQTMRRKSLGKS